MLKDSWIIELIMNFILKVISIVWCCMHVYDSNAVLLLFITVGVFLDLFLVLYFEMFAIIHHCGAGGGTAFSFKWWVQGSHVRWEPPSEMAMVSLSVCWVGQAKCLVVVMSSYEIIKVETWERIIRQRLGGGSWVKYARTGHLLPEWGLGNRSHEWSEGFAWSSDALHRPHTGVVQFIRQLDIILLSVAPWCLLNS